MRPPPRDLGSSGRRALLALFASVLAHALMLGGWVAGHRSSPAAPSPFAPPSPAAPLPIALLEVAVTRPASGINRGQTAVAQAPKMSPQGGVSEPAAGDLAPPRPEEIAVSEVPARAVGAVTPGEEPSAEEAPPFGAAVGGAGPPWFGEGAAQGGSGAGRGGASGAGSGPLDWAAAHRKLSLAARSCYPPRARRFQLVGTTQVRFCLGVQGELLGSTVLASSGSPLLDQAAQGCVVGRAVPLPLPPGCYEQPVQFRLTDG
jgi:periplasmic protein TonB